MRRWTSEYRRIAPGNAGTRVTLRAMRKLASLGAADPVVIAAAHDVVRSVPERNDLATVNAILRDVRNRMRYTHDPVDTELVKHPREMIEASDRHGKDAMDCDDASVLLSSMLGAVGIPTRFVVTPSNPRTPGTWTHVYVRARLGDGREVPIDPIVREWGPGREVPDHDVHGTRAEFPAALEGLNMLHCNRPSLLAGLGFGPGFNAGAANAAAASAAAAAASAASGRTSVPPAPASAPPHNNTSVNWNDLLQKSVEAGTAYLSKQAASEQARVASDRQRFSALNRTSASSPHPWRTPAAPSRPGFFQSRDPFTGMIQTDWTKVGGAVAVAALAVALVSGRRR